MCTNVGMCMYECVYIVFRYLMNMCVCVCVITCLFQNASS
jgi:hypothetical protein